MVKITSEEFWEHSRKKGRSGEGGYMDIPNPHPSHDWIDNTPARKPSLMEVLGFKPKPKKAPLAKEFRRR